MNTNDAGKNPIDCVFSLLKNMNDMEEKSAVSEIEDILEYMVKHQFTGAYMFSGSEKNPHDPSRGCKYAKLGQAVLYQIGRYMERINGKELYGKPDGEFRKEIGQSAEIIL